MTKIHFALSASVVLAAAGASSSHSTSARFRTWQIVTYPLSMPSFSRANALATDARSNVYVADSEHNQIQKLSPSGVRLAVFGSFGWKPGYFRNPTGVTVDRQGNMYVTDSANNRIQKLSSSGRPLTVWRGGGRRWCGDFGLERSVAVDTRGYIYVDVLNGCTAQSRTSAIEKLSPQGKVTASWAIPPCRSLKQCWRNNVDIAVDKRAADLVLDRWGNVYLPYFPNGLDCTDTPLGYIYKLSPQGHVLERWSFPRFDCTNAPQGFALDTQGNVYVADNPRILKLSPRGNVLAEWKGHPVEGSMAFDAQSNLYVITGGWQKNVAKLSPTGHLVSKWGMWGTAPGRFQFPSGVAVDRQENAYVADTWNNRMQKLILDPTRRALVAHRQWPPSEVTSMNLPTSVLIDRQRNIVVGDYGDHQLKTFSASGKLLRVVQMPGPSAAGSGYWNGTGPMGLALDTRANFVITDPGNRRVEKLSPSGKLLASYHEWATTRSSRPGSVAIDIASNIYVVDSVTSRIVKLSPSGRRLAVWGTFGYARPGQFNHPQGIAVDARGNVYVSDTGNSRIQELSPTGRPLNMWGGLGSAPGQFMYPLGLTIDPKGIVCVADAWNSRIQELMS